MKVDIVGLLGSPKLAERVLEQASDRELAKLADQIDATLASGRFVLLDQPLKALKSLVRAEQQSR